LHNKPLEIELQQFYKSVDVVVNVGQKVETLAPIQLIANGAFYIGPRFDHPVGRAPGAANLATNPFGSLPSFRTLDCHIPFIDEKIRTNRQRLQDFSTMKEGTIFLEIPIQCRDRRYSDRNDQ